MILTPEICRVTWSILFYRIPYNKKCVWYSLHQAQNILLQNQMLPFKFNAAILSFKSLFRRLANSFDSLAIFLVGFLCRHLCDISFIRLRKNFWSCWIWKVVFVFRLPFIALYWYSTQCLTVFLIVTMT